MCTCSAINTAAGLALLFQILTGSRFSNIGIQQGCSPDNSACEGFFGRLKNEMFYGKSWEGFSLAQFMASLDSYMQWYKEKRIKVSLGGLSLLEYREALGLA
jgi:transposase InsO family protein